MAPDRLPAHIPAGGPTLMALITILSEFSKKSLLGRNNFVELIEAGYKRGWDRSLKNILLKVLYLFFIENGSFR